MKTIKLIFDFIKQIWPAVKICIKTVAPIL